VSRRRNNRPQQRNNGHATAKALPPGAYAGANRTNTPQAQSFAQLLNRLAPATPWGTADSMPRDSLDAVPFGPINPLRPAPISPSRTDTGRPEPRIREYPVGWNIPGNDNRLIPWDVLYNAADQVDIMRRCIEVRKRHVRSLKWAWNVSEQAVSAAYRADPRFGQDDLEAQLRDKYWPDIKRLTEFWTKPWRTKGLNLGQWVNAIQDQHLVLDAVAIYPRMTYGGNLFALELLDGSTIKPLIDWRGDRPTYPYPAYQQEIYGFPRGEYTATSEIDADGAEIVTHGYAADQLYYWQEVFRPRSFYGFSAVEQALMAARLYVKRQGWMLSEYDDGSTPMTWLVPDGTAATELDPRQRTEWERAINDDLAGQTAARHRIKLSYPGFKPDMMPSVDERYKPDYDLFLIKLLAAHFGVPITELGFSESKGLGSSGYHEGQEDVMDRVGRRPDIAILEEIVNDISHRFLGAPAELQFQFLGLESEDEAAQDAVADARVKSGRMTLNEDRKRQGLPLYDFAEADMPMISTGRGVVFIEDASTTAPPGMLVSPAQAPPTTTPPEGANAQPGAGRRAADPAQGTPAPGPTATAKAADPTRAVADSDSTRKRVHDQLAEDYPEAAMTWLKSAVWSGPESIPTADVDFSNEDDWRATAEPDKVGRFVEKIGQGKLKPIILVNTPDARKYIVIDGHHRALAYRKLGIPAMAYIGRVAEKPGPWDQMHASQRTSTTGPDGTAAKAADTDPTTAAAIAAELAAWRNWAKKARQRGRAGHPFVFTHPQAEAAAKASVVRPKAPGTARQWPGWERDRDTATITAARIRAALITAVNPERLASQWANARGLDKALAAPTDASTWLNETNTRQAIVTALTAVLAGAYAEGYLIGDRSATAMLGIAKDAADDAVDTATITADWGGWTPGDTQAATLILGNDGLGAGLQQLLDDSGITIKSIGAGRFDELAQSLALSLERGDSADTLARDLRDILDNASRAGNIAMTEINRAVSAATLANYQANGVEAKDWLTAADGRVCAICDGNADDGPIPLGAVFSSGDAAPPAHPGGCRCALGPAIITPAEASTEGTA
jgi:SPP1 gp7 family putative phage head morphogenesis protein